MSITAEVEQARKIQDRIVQKFQEYRIRENIKEHDLIYINLGLERYSREGDVNRDINEIPFNCHGCDGEGVCPFMGPLIRGKSYCTIRENVPDAANNMITECTTRRILRYRKVHPDTDES